ncbi:M48 family metallopeptidase [Ornithobacterium rhinotracheale]|nr:YgjP-like metallopeptidase domain-containing protein [Ornithobacterium rhinotracheale]MCK0205592.1 M48 family metallopeptidase [Ornithobacterium rhinotracheale]
MEKIIYGKSIIEFSISYSDRKTLGITVNPDLSVNIKAPLNSKKEDIFKIVEKRVPWILEQKRFFLSFEPRRTEYLYKSGETHYYLGRQYLLKIVEGKAEDVFYKGRYLLIETNDKSPLNIKKLLDRWYRDRAKIKFAEIAEPLIQQFKKYEVEPNNLYIQNMKFRWGVVQQKEI